MEVSNKIGSLQGGFLILVFSIYQFFSDRVGYHFIVRGGGGVLSPMGDNRRY